MSPGAYVFVCVVIVALWTVWFLADRMPPTGGATS